MNETVKEKTTRYVLIVIFVCMTIIALINRQEKLTIRESTYPPHAIVLHTSIDEMDNPVVLLYEHKNKQHILGIYEIDKHNRYKFISNHIIYLDDAVEQLLLDKNEGGIWVNSNGQWIFFNMSLHEEKRDLEIGSMRNPSIVPFTFDKENAKVILHDKLSIPLSKEEVPREIHMLSEDGFSWLVLTDKKVQIATTHE